MYTISEGLSKLVIPFFAALGVGFFLWISWQIVKSAINSAKRPKPNYSKEVDWLLEMEEWEREMYHDQIKENLSA